MADINTPTTGAETTLSLSIDGVPVLIAAQVDNVTENEEATIVDHKPLGTMTTKLAVDYGGWGGRISAKPTNGLLPAALDTLETAARTGLPSIVTMTVARTFRDGTSQAHMYTNVVLTQAGGSRQRGQMDTIELNWRSGDQRVTL